VIGRRRFVRDHEGRVRPGLDRAGRELLRALPRQAQTLLEHDDASAARLFPVAYPGNESSEAEYREMMGSQLLQRHQQALDTLASTVDAPSVDDDELHQWLGALEVLRLVLGTQLDVSEDMTDIDPTDPEAQQFAVYQYLSILQSEIVDTLADALPEVDDDEVDDVDDLHDIDDLRGIDDINDMDDIGELGGPGGLDHGDPPGGRDPGDTDPGGRDR
jgi:hypothetical protein